MANTKSTPSMNKKIVQPTKKMNSKSNKSNKSRPGKLGYGKRGY